MKILILTERLGSRSGWERYSAELVQSLKASGHEVLVLCSKENSEFTDIAQKTVLPPALSSRRCFWFANVYTHKAEKVLNFEGFKPDVIHILVEPYAYIGNRVGNLLNCPFILTMHGSFAVRPFLSFLYAGFARTAYMRAKRIICISHYTESRVKEFVPEAKTEIIANGVSFNVATESHHSSVKNPNIISVGALKERKGYIELLNAMPYVRELIPEVRLTIVGNQSDTAYVDSVNKAIERLGLVQTIVFKQNISDEQLADLYQNAKVFVLTPVSSQESFEGFGLVYLEANSHGVPAIGSYGNGGEDAIADGKSGFLVHVDDPKDIAKKIIHVLKMPESEYSELSREALQHAAKFSWERALQYYEQVYKTV